MQRTINANKIITVILAAVLLVSLIPMLSFNSSAAISYYSATGSVTDATMNTITIYTHTGKYRTFTKDEAHITGAPHGIAVGDTVKIIYHIERPQIAVKIVMVAHGDSRPNVPQQQIHYYSFSGWITSMDYDDHTITVQNLNSGYSKVFTFTYATTMDSPDGMFANGDVVKVIYHKDTVDAAEKITMVDMGNNH